MELIGTIKHVFDEQRISDSFKKKEMVLTTEEQYPQHILIEFTQDRISLLGSFKPGNKVKVSINIRGREWTSPQGQVKYFVSIQGWKIENIEQQPIAQNTAFPQNSESLPVQNPLPVESDNNEDDLPF